jgi:hypothetical protein
MTNFLAIFQHLLPRTKTWSLVVDRMLRRLFSGIDIGLATPAKSAVDSVWTTLDPDTTDELAEWENQFGLWETGTDAARRAAYEAAWDASTGQSPRYLQDRLQAAGFDVYYHGWRESDGSVRDPRTYAVAPLIGAIQCYAPATDPDCVVCGAADDLGTPVCDGFVVNELNYLVNEALDGRAPPWIPDSEYRWRYFCYVGGATFGTEAEVALERRVELKRLILKYFPAHLWIVLLVTEPTYTQVFSTEFSDVFG